MAAKQKNQANTRYVLLRITRMHFLYVVAYMLSIIIFDSWNLITHEAVLQRWTLAGSLLIVNTIIWYLCKVRFKNDYVYRWLLVALIAADVVFAATNVYWQRGMASKAVMLFAVPIISAALVRSRSLLVAVTTLSAAAYSIAAVVYFNQNYGQGFKIELYGEIFFYSALFFVLAGLLMINFRPAKD